MKPKYEPSEVEPRIYSMWEDSGAFKAGANAKDGHDSFCIMIPPPNVTGALHMGHAFNNTLQDILIRWHRMKGYDVLWQPGQDHAGIATQMVVERQLAEAGLPSRNQLGRNKFLEKVWDWKEQSGGEIINQLKRIGASCDWSRNRFTMDKGFHDAVLKAFIEFYKKELIFKGKRLVNWDPHFETAISDLEVEQVEVNGNMWYFRYPLADGASFDYPVAFDENGDPARFEKRDYLVVATTRPETMLGDTGVAVHPEDARYTHLIGKDVVLPLVGRRIRIVADSYADPTKGSGAVKITPAHDFNDWEVGKRTELPAINVMTSKARMYLKENTDFLGNLNIPESTLELDGLDRFEARNRIVEQMTEKGLLDDVKTELHTVPHGDRSNIPIEPFLTDQWFLDTKKIVGPAIEAVRNGQTRIHPKQYEKIYFNWLENIEP
ncbi:MAG: class I tRNA ligase family protein, partial [Paracoccaceae bacterium]|nr:class I tRNA ligase family protein [Paracoccaceae bacterium]